MKISLRLNSTINEKSIVLPLGEVKITKKVNSVLIIFRTNTDVEIWDQNKKRLFEQENDFKEVIKKLATDAIVTAAVKTIRAGERSKKVEPIIPGTSSNETLALINQYINEGKSLIISYADNNGGVSNRIIEPISISLGTLTARDETSDEILQFRIPRINGVAPSLTNSENKADLDL